MRTAQVLATAMLNAGVALFNSGSAVCLNGTQPATPETALSGNTTLCIGTYSATAFGAPTYASGYMSATGSFSAGTFNPVANGACTFIRCYESNGTTAICDLSVGSAWIASNVTAVGQYCTNGGNTYKCVVVTGAATTAASGGPTGTGNNIVDGNVTWDYVGTPNNTWAASTAYTVNQVVVMNGNYYICVQAGTSASSGGPSGTSDLIVDGTVAWTYAGAAGLFDVTLGNCNIQVGVPVSFTHTYKQPAV